MSTFRHYLLIFAPAILLTFSPECLSQQTGEQRYFEWTQLPFPKEEYQERRNKMIEALKSSATDIFLCPSRDGLSDGSTFRQLDDFNYFTGLEDRK
ncbi:MAG: hypothetical protein RIA63_12055, partial [Cyclobacteriaceae bacterium]